MRKSVAGSGLGSHSRQPQNPSCYTSLKPEVPVKQASENYLLEKYWFNCLRQNTQASWSVFIYFIIFKCTPLGGGREGGGQGGNQYLNKETFACCLSTLNGISFPCRGKPGQFTADPTQVCTAQLLKCACATVPTAKLDWTYFKILKFFHIKKKCTNQGTRTQGKQ